MNSPCSPAVRATSRRAKVEKTLPETAPMARPIEALESRIAPATLFGLDDANHLIRFDSATPGTIDSVTVTGLAAGETLHAVDFRPATGQLYALGIVEGAGTDDATGRIYTINTTTGAATQVGAAPFSTTLADDADYGFDFNPTVDRIRIVNSADQNLRVHPDTGALAATDTALDNAADTEEIVGSAYDRSGGGATATTTLFGIDFANNALVRQGGADGTPSPNLGAITAIGDLGVTLTSPDVGFDIAPGTGTGYATLTVGGTTGLYTINLATGAATLVGNVGAGTTSLRGLAAASTSLVVAGTAGADSLVVTATGANSGSYSLNGGTAVPFTGITEFTFDGGAGADTLTINNPAGSVFAPTGGIFYNAQDPTTTPGDTLILAGGGGAAFTQTITPGADAASGTIATSNATLTQTITFGGVEALTDTVTTGTFDINLTAGVDTVSVTTGPLAGTDQTITVGDGAGGTFQDVSFANKGNVRVNGLGGADAFTLNETGATAGTGVTSLTLFGHSTSGTGDDDAADTFLVTDTVSLTSINAGGGNDTISFAAGATLSGGTITGGAGTDTVDYSAYTTGVAVNLGSTAGTLNATLGADQEVPANATTSTGTATLTYNSANHTFNITVNVTGINPVNVTGFHIHNAVFGETGLVIVDFVPGGVPISPLTPTANGFTFTANNVALPNLNEGALLGGVTYLNIHTSPNFPGGQIRGQIFPAAALVAGTGTATGTAGISGVENVVGGTGADSLVGDLAANVLTGGAGNDTIVGSGGADTVIGGADNDTLVWDNGDGSDVIDGGDGTDKLQINGAVTGADVFSIGAGPGGRIDFDRTSLVPFSLDIGTVESLVVNGVGGDDVFNVNDLTTVTDLTSLSVNGNEGSDTFNLGVASGTTLPAAISLSINGGSSTAAGANDDIVNVTTSGARAVTFTYQSDATGGVAIAGLGSTVDITAAERVNYVGDSANDDSITVIGTASADLLSVRPTGPASAEVSIRSSESPAPAGSGLSPDLALSGIGGPLHIDGGSPTSGSPGDRLAYLGAGSLTSAGAGSGTINSTAGFVPVQFTSIESITGLTPILNGGNNAFSSPTSYEVGTTPRGIATGDLNGDGFVDMVTANAASNTISILLGAGDGTFLTPVSRSSGGLKPVALTLGDFNGDGNLDVAVVNRGSSAVNILNGAGNGTFTAGAILAVAAGANAIEAGNLDSDADLDLAVTSADSNRVNILLNGGSGVFGTAVQVATRGQVPRDLAIGDFNGDGNADLAIANSGTDNIGILTGTAAGVFTPLTKIKVGDKPTSLALADLNGDGNLDIVASHAVSRFASVLLGTGASSGSLFDRQLRINIGATIAPAAVTTGDFNADGVIDLAFARGKASGFTIALGIGNGTFGPATSFALVNEPASNTVAIALADFDGDGSLDVATANVGSNDVAVATRAII